MLIRYTFKLRDPVIFEDFWPISIMGGKLHAFKSDGKITGFQVEFENQDPDFSPSLSQANDTEVKAHIVGRDKLLPFVKIQIEEAFSYLQCYFNVEINTDEIGTEYIAESEEEQREIQVMSFEIGTNDLSPIVPFDMFTRAVMAAEQGPSPVLESRFLQMARAELLRKRYIDSFRYSFLLIESVYGNGKFKSSALKNELKRNLDFVRIVTNALAVRIRPRNRKQCDTERLLSANAHVENIIDHIVEKRGFYFHGNVKQRNPWRPDEQEKAESLGLLAFAMANLIAQDAAKPMFDEALIERYHRSAKEAGAIMKTRVIFRFREPTESFDRDGHVEMNVPGTIPTAKQVVYLANTFLEYFRDQLPTADLISATCVDVGNDKQLFTFQVKVRKTAV